jgi:hypothetical protein
VHEGEIETGKSYYINKSGKVVWEHKSN